MTNNLILAKKKMYSGQSYYNTAKIHIMLLDDYEIKNYGRMCHSKM